MDGKEETHLENLCAYLRNGENCTSICSLPVESDLASYTTCVSGRNGKCRRAAEERAEVIVRHRLESTDAIRHTLDRCFNTAFIYGMAIKA